MSATYWRTCNCPRDRHNDGCPLRTPMVRMSLAFLRGIVEPYGGFVQYQGVDPEGYVTGLLINTPPCPDTRKRR